MDEQYEQHNDQPEQQQLLTPNELVDRDVAIILGRRGLITVDGKPDRAKLGDLLEPIMRKARVDAPGERSKQTVWANDLMQHEIFPDVPGRDLWVEQDDPEHAERVFMKLRGEITRVLNTKPHGEVQSRLASNGGLVLCDVTTTRSGGDKGWYTTRNPKCITEDLGVPARKKALAAMNAFAALTEMAIERVPEHAKKFDRDYKSGQKLITDGPATIVRGALEAATADSGDTDNGDDE